MNRPPDTLRGPYGPQGSSPPKRQVLVNRAIDPARKEREELLLMLQQQPGWQVLVRGINLRRSRLIGTLATGRQLELTEIRSLQDQLALLAGFVRDPVTFLLEFDTTERMTEEIDTTERMTEEIDGNQERVEVPRAERGAEDAD